MQRRQFVQAAALGAGALSIGACSTTYPGEAVAPWAGPPAHADARLWALSHAILAPSSHNRQPWLVDLSRPDTIVLHVDRERLLPETDPWFRQIVVSQGTFLELLVIALRERGVEPRVELFPEGEFGPRQLDERPVARISWGTERAAGRDPLFAQIRKRNTAKVDYDTARAVPAPVLPALRSALLSDAGVGLSFDGTVDAARLEPLRALCWQSAQVEIGTPAAAMESMRLTRVGPAEIATHRDGISVNGLMPRAFAALGLFDRTSFPGPGSSAYAQIAKRFEGHSRTAMGFVWLGTATAENAAAGRLRRAEVEAGRAYARLQLKATELGLQMHPMSQAAQEFAEMKPHYDALHRMLAGEPQGARTVQMFCRIGYCADQQHSPRRGVHAIVRS